MSKPISQREARRLRKRVHDLELAEQERRYCWAQEWVGGTMLGCVQFADHLELLGRIRAARMLNHAVVVTADAASDSCGIRFHALPLAKDRPQ